MEIGNENESYDEKIDNEKESFDEKIDNENEYYKDYRFRYFGSYKYYIPQRKKR